MSYDTWKCTDPADAADASLPCRYETLSGECMVCGARDGERCEVEHERWLTRVNGMWAREY